MLVETHKAINQLHKEIRDLNAGIVSVEALIVEKQKAIESLELLLNEEQLKVVGHEISDGSFGGHQTQPKFPYPVFADDWKPRDDWTPPQDITNESEHTAAGAEDAIYNNTPEDTDVGMAGVSYWNMIDALGKNVADIINNPNATAEGVLQHVEHIRQQVENIKAEFEDKYMK